MVLLSAAILGLSTVMTGLTSLLTGLTGQVIALPGRITGATKTLTKAFSGLDISLKNLNKTFQQSIVAADEAQKRTLAFGKDFTGFSKTFKAQIDKIIKLTRG